MINEILKECEYIAKNPKKVVFQATLLKELQSFFF